VEGRARRGGGPGGGGLSFTPDTEASRDAALVRRILEAGG